MRAEDATREQIEEVRRCQAMFAASELIGQAIVTLVAGYRQPRPRLNGWSAEEGWHNGQQADIEDISDALAWILDDLWGAGDMMQALQKREKET